MSAQDLWQRRAELEALYHRHLRDGLDAEAAATARLIDDILERLVEQGEVARDSAGQWSVTNHFPEQI